MKNILTIFFLIHFIIAFTSCFDKEELHRDKAATMIVEKYKLLIDSLKFHFDDTLVFTEDAFSFSGLRRYKLLKQY